MTNTNNVGDEIRFPLYPTDYPIERNLGCGFRVISSIFIAVACVSLGVLHPLLVVPSLFLVIIIKDSLFRKFMPDWPRQKHFIGELVFTKSELKIVSTDSENIIIPYTSIRECLLFFCFYKNHVQGKGDIEKTGNAGLFILLNDASKYFKFNIPDETGYRAILIQMEELKNLCPYVRLYGLEDTSHILTDDLSRRRVFK